MSENHNGGNAIPEITREEHDGSLNAKRVSIVAGAVGNATVNIAGSATIYAVVNTSAPGVSNSIVTIANTPLDTQIIGNVTLSGPLPTGLNNIGFATVAVSTPTIFAVVNTGASGDPKTYIGLTTTTLGISDQFVGLVTVVQSSSNRSIVGNVTLDDGSLTGLVAGINSIGFATVHIGTPTIFAVVNTGAPGTTDITSNSGITVYQGGTWTVTQASSARTITGNVTLSDSKTFIGLTTVNIGSSNTVVLGSGVGNIGFATVNQVNQPALVAGSAYVGLMTVDIGTNKSISILGNVTLTDPKTFIGLATTVNGAGTRFIGLVTVVQSSSARTITGNVTLSDSKTYIGLNTVTVGVGDKFIGLVTAQTRNAGSAKTLVPVPFAFGSSVATIAVPTNANVMYITNMILSANATTQVRMKSGVTYMTGNASIGISLNPNGGYVLTGSPDSPSWIGCPSGAVVLEKNDATTLVGGHLIYFQE